MAHSEAELYLYKFSTVTINGKDKNLVSDKYAVELSYDFLERAGLMLENFNALKKDHIGGKGVNNSKIPEKKELLFIYYRELYGLRVKVKSLKIMPLFLSFYTKKHAQLYCRCP
ncbi:MAG: hypothetical protein SWO11_16815 [Thermodesulfobacteriota bacterium]|nr:hypothetical protein [Thermodesulfobacteriota bacterium]